MQLFMVCYIYVRVFFMVFTPLHTSIVLYSIYHLCTKRFNGKLNRTRNKKGFQNKKKKQKSYLTFMNDIYTKSSFIHK